jgi:hypothetical protein
MADEFEHILVKILHLIAIGLRLRGCDSSHLPMRELLVANLSQTFENVFM